MHARSALALVAGLLAATQACARPSECPKMPAAAAVVPAVTPVVRDVPRVEVKPPSASGVCWKKGRPRTDAPKAEEHPFCSALDAAEVASVEARVRRDFVVHEKPSKLIVDFGCDVAREPHEVVLETGSGHGGSLRIVRFQWQADGRVLVRRVVRSHYYDVKTTVERAEITAAKLEPIIAKSRVALVVRPHVVRLSVPNGTIGLGSVSWSSNDFHLLLRIEDEDARVTERRYTGYDASSAQEDIFPMRLATDPLVKLVDALPFVTDAPNDDDRAFVTARFRSTMASSPEWWIRERYVALVEALGTIDAVPALVALVAGHGDASAARTREAAVAALAHVTGWDPRVDEQGRKRSLDEAAERIAVECAP